MSYTAVSIHQSDTSLLTAKEVAALLKVGTKKVYALPIPRVRLSAKRIRYSYRDVRAYLARCRRGL